MENLPVARSRSTRGRQGGVRAFTLRSIDLVPYVGKVSQVVTVHKGTEKRSASRNRLQALDNLLIDFMLAYACLHNKVENIKEAG